ncbi:hypothetical protein C2G38_2202872 [Gigaspora rosea]|uniref:Uncharacterized protein n=1 Tax=Gigaspora rosea TaxID=44941 RepID=A0A397UND1_9GLOM|nr:hypothetical protein C2G38_2202872 [Gigaspora rosea]
MTFSRFLEDYKQVIKFSCMEGQYLGLFRQYLTRVFVFFQSDADAYQTISSLLGDYCWGVNIISETRFLTLYCLLFKQLMKAQIPALDALIAKKAEKKKKERKIG